MYLRFLLHFIIPVSNLGPTYFQPDLLIRQEWYNCFLTKQLAIRILGKLLLAVATILLNQLLCKTGVLN